MSNRAKALLLIIVDIAFLYLSMMTVICLRDGNLDEHIGLFNQVFPLWILIFFIEGIYSLRVYNPANLPISSIRTTILSTIVSMLFIYLFPDDNRGLTPKTNLVLIAALSLPLMYFWRKFFFTFFSRASRLRDTVLIGSPSTLKLVQEEIDRKPHLGYRVVASYTPDITEDFSIPDQTQLVAIERNITKETKVFQKIFSLLGSQIEVMDLAHFAEKISGKIPLNSIDESWFIEYCGHHESRTDDLLKLMIDKTVAIILLILLVPVAAIVLPLLLIFHGRPIFFKQQRTGQNNKTFKLYKLRSMVVDAEKNGAQWAKPGDARVTKIGKFLRKSRFDELPQLINIIRGEMSLVGPRPERPEMIKDQLAPNIPFYNLRHLVKPGVTGWAQVTFRYGFSQEDSAEKLQFDLFYVKNRNIWLDMVVILKTIKTVLTGAGQ